MEKPIRVLNLFTIMDCGGAETMVMNYYRNINRDLVQFDFMVHRDKKGEYDDEIKSLGGKIYHMDPIYPNNFSHYKKQLSDFFTEHSEYKIIHSHMSELGYFAFKIAKEKGVPVRICHAHNAPNSFDIKMIMRNYFKHKMLPYDTHLFTCGLNAAKWLYGEKNQNRFIQLNNAIDTDKFLYNEKVENNIREKYNLGNKFVVGHIGRFNRQKNHTFLIDVFSEICRMRSNSVLVLVGAGELEKDIKNYAIEKNVLDKIVFTGIIKNVNEVVQCFNAFVFPSLFEGLSVTVVENQAASNLCFISKEIPQECVISDKVIPISLKESPKVWAETVLKYTDSYKKVNMKNQIVEAKVDIKNNAKWLQEFYINEYNKYK